jgi:DNA-binding transcriptional LysR family regulator
MNWDDLRYVLALARAGSLAKAARALRVDHTTVGRRIEALEADLRTRLFTRTPTGYVLTVEAERILPEMEQVEAAALTVERAVASEEHGLAGPLRVTSAETFGVAYLAPRLARFGAEHPAVSVELVLGPAVFDLGRREADVAVRFFRSESDHLVISRAGEIAHAFYATAEYLARHGGPPAPADLAAHRLFVSDLTSGRAELAWLVRLCPDARVALFSNLTLAILEATRSGTGLGLLPRYLGDPDPTLRRVPLPDEPRQAIWLTVHEDLKQTRRVRILLDFLRCVLAEDRARLAGPDGG